MERPPKFDTVFDFTLYNGQLALSFAQHTNQNWLELPVTTATHLANHIIKSLSLKNEREQDVAIHDMTNTGILHGTWAASGFPTISLTHATAAALSATKISPQDAEEFVKPPYPGFAIRLPTPLFEIESQGGTIPAHVVLVSAVLVNDKHRWYYKIIADYKHPKDAEDDIDVFLRGVGLWGFNVDTSQLPRKDIETQEGYQRWDNLQATDIDFRADLLIRNLIMGVCILLTADPTKRPNGTDTTIKTISHKKRTQDQLPSYTEFRIKSAIKINLTDAIRNFNKHGGSSPSIQTLVRGYWKRQHHGKNSLLRRLQFISAHWKGDPTAPISARIK